MPLSPMNEIFILLEDEKVVPLYRINRWGTQARGVLAKLTNLGWAEKITDNNEPAYKITEKGEQAIDKVLKPLKSDGAWDGKWRLVMFDVPESKRDVRDKLRRELSKLGLGILQSSVWISPLDIKKEIDIILKKYSLGSGLKFFEVTRNQSLDKTIIEKSWKLPEIADEYKKFNFETERILKTIDRVPNQKFVAKKLIFQLALIKQKDPYLPKEFRSADALRSKADELYQTLRAFAN